MPYYIFRYRNTINEKCPSMSDSWKGIRGPIRSRTSDSLIMSFLYSVCYLVRKNWDIWGIFKINRGLDVCASIINCSFYVKYSTGLHGFVDILAWKLAPNFKSHNISFSSSHCLTLSYPVLFLALSLLGEGLLSQGCVLQDLPERSMTFIWSLFKIFEGLIISAQLI